MKVLMITGDKRFGPGNPRFELQKSAVEELDVVYFGRGSLWPRLPKKEFNIVTVQDPFWRGVFAWIVARRLNARFNVQVHTDLSAHSFVRHVLAQIVLRHADTVRVVSEKIKKQVERIGVSAPISVLPVYIDISKFQAVVRRPHTGKNILWIGRFEEEKNPRAAIKIFKTICDAVPDTTLVMLGQGGMEAELKELAQGLRVEFPGWQDPKPYLETANVVVCTSWHESFGASIIESLAAGVSVVAPDVGVAREAGAIVVPRAEMAHAVVQTLRAGKGAELKLTMPTEEEWKHQWQNTL